MAWHQGYDCKEFDTELANNPDLRTDKMILEFTKKCPNCVHQYLNWKDVML